MVLAAPTWHKDSWKNHIKDVVVLVEENMSFDRFAGDVSYDLSIDSLVHCSYHQPSNVSYPQNSEIIYSPSLLHKTSSPDDPTTASAA